MKITMEEQKLYDDFTASVFQRGYEKGKEDATISYQNAYNEGNVDGYSRGYDEGVKDGQKGKISEMLVDTYIQGLNDAWEYARKITLNSEDGGIPYREFEKIFDDITSPYAVFRKYTISEAIAKIKEYEDKKNEIHIGDEVVSDSFDEKGIVTHITDKGCVSLICGMNSMISTGLDKVHKTGKSYPQIVEILEQLKGDSEE